MKEQINQKVEMHQAHDYDDGYINKLELQESERKYRRIFEYSMDSLVLWNDDYRIVDINCMASKMFGNTKDYLMGLEILDLFKHNIREPARNTKTYGTSHSLWRFCFNNNNRNKGWSGKIF